MPASPIPKNRSREWQSAFVALGVALIACFLGTVNVRVSPFTALAMIFVLLAGLVVLLVPDAWMAVVVVALPFSDYAADKLHLPYSFGAPARWLLLLILIAAVGRYLTARTRSSAPSAEPASRRARQALLATAGLFAVFLCWSAFVRSADPLEVIAFGFDVFVIPVLAFWALSSILPRAKRVKPVIWVATASLAVQVALGLYEYITHKGVATLSVVEGPKVSFGLTSQILGVRADGSFLRTEDYAFFCAAIALLLIGYWLNRSRWKLACVMFGLGAVGSFVSGLRGILIPFILIAGGMFLRASGRLWKNLFVGTTVAFVAAVLLVPSIDFNSYGVYRERLRNTETIYIRVASYATALAVFHDHWVTGVGIGNYGPEATQSDNVRFYKGSPSVPFTHNSFLAFLADGGVVGGALYVA
ncbi:MAG: O-antigen ligase family protein, partial [Actinobacteria bacterium]|nr:O-antigen ligase family protein [Actinomycetota bacterium]